MIRIQREQNVLPYMNVNYMLLNLCFSSLIVVIIIFVREVVFNNVVRYLKNV